MRIVDPIEGDYIETKRDNLFFDVKGLFHPNDYVICFLRFFPHSEGERLKNGLFFKKVYKLNKRYDILRKNYPKYIFFSEELDLEVQGVKNEEIKTIYSPRTFFKDLLKKNEFSINEARAKSLCELFITDGNLSEKSIGITGSIMVGLNMENSDIDLIIYGTETSINFQDTLKNIFKKSNDCKKYTIDEYRTHYNWRFGGSNIPFGTFLKSEERKLHQGKFKGHDFFIRYIKSPKDWKGNFYDYRYRNLGRITLKADIIDSKDSIFTPCTYKIKSRKILKISTRQNNININHIKEINSFRGRFCEQAKKGEKVILEGKLEKVNFKEESAYFRILLSDPTYDKMIII